MVAGRKGIIIIDSTYFLHFITLMSSHRVYNKKLLVIGRKPGDILRFYWLILEFNDLWYPFWPVARTLSTHNLL